MAYDPARNLGPNPTNPTDYRTTVVERESSGVAWVVIGLLFAAIVAAIFFLVRPGGDATVIQNDPAILAPADPALAPADPAVNMAPADDFDAGVAPAGDAGALDGAAVPADEVAPAPID